MRVTHFNPYGFLLRLKTMFRLSISMTINIFGFSVLVIKANTCVCDKDC